MKLTKRISFQNRSSKLGNKAFLDTYILKIQESFVSIVKRFRNVVSKCKCYEVVIRNNKVFKKMLTSYWSKQNFFHVLVTIFKMSFGVKSTSET